MSHIPVHPSTFGKAHKVNVHGHIHDKRVRHDVDTSGTWEFIDFDKAIWHGNIDKRYFCVSCEHINYTPMELGAIEIEVFGLDSREKVLDELAKQAQKLDMGY